MGDAFRQLVACYHGDMMDFVRKASLSAMGFMYFFAGIYHFTRFDYFMGIMPAFMPQPRALVIAGGVVHLLFAAFLIPRKTRSWACYAIMIFWTLSIPISAYILYLGGACIPLSPWILKARIPFHLLLMLWAFWNSQTQVKKHHRVNI
jgi:uncharacterized membrane protein